jgi:hypothetical protein
MLLTPQDAELFFKLHRALMFSGLRVDIRQAPGHLQEIAFNKGLIPYIPADRRQGG